MATAPPVPPAPAPAPPVAGPGLWAIIQCSSDSFDPRGCFLHPTILEKGWRAFFAPRLEMIRRHKPRGVILHCWRGMRPPRPWEKGRAVQSFTQRRRLRENVVSSAQLLDTRIDEVHAFVREAKKTSLAVSYEGVPEDSLADLEQGQVLAIVEHELCDPVTRQFEFDGVILDGASSMVPGGRGDARGILAKAIDDGLRPRIPTGIEAMAVDKCPWLSDRLSLTLAGEVANLPVGDPGYLWKMETGAFDPEKTIIRDDPPRGTRLHGKFEPIVPVHKGGGEAIVLDLFDPAKDLERYKRRQALIAAAGCSPCVPLEQMDSYAGWLSSGVRL